MNSLNSYQLYIGNDCCTCKKVQQFLKNKHLSITTFNIDEDTYNLPFSLMIIPALIKDNKVIAYGYDIISNLQKKTA